jgi:hypothetical protein
VVFRLSQIQLKWAVFERKPKEKCHWSELERLERVSLLLEMDNNDDAQRIINDDPNGNNDMV